MTTSDKDDGRSPGGPLLIAWLIVFAAVAGTVAWLYFYGEQPGAVATAGIPRAVAPIPPSPEQAAGEAPPQQASAAPESPPPAPSAATEAAKTPPAETAPAPPAKPVESVEAKPLETKPPPEAAAPPPEAAAPPPEPAPAEAKPSEAKPPETKPAEAKSSEAKSIKAKPTETKPAETKPAETKLAETKPAEPAPHETKAAASVPAKPEAMKPPPEAEKAKEGEAPSAPPTGSPPSDKQIAALPSGAAPHAPDPALIEHGRQGPLPTIGPDGRQPWQTYARPFDETDKRPRIAIVITDLGLSEAATETAIQQLPGSVTLSFSPYAKGLDQWANLARAAGHELLLDLPMEPLNYPEQDPGPYTLLTSLDPQQNLFKMQWLLSRATGYVGVTNHMGSRFTTSGPDLKPVLEQIKARGLLFLDSHSSEQSIAAKLAKDTGMAWAINNRFIDATASRDAIDNELADVQKIAKKSGYAVAMGSAYPVTIERVAAWIPKAEAAGFAIAPVSAIAKKQPLK